MLSESRRKYNFPVSKYCAEFLPFCSGEDSQTAHDIDSVSGFVNIMGRQKTHTPMIGLLEVTRGQDAVFTKAKLVPKHNLV